ncbi:pilus assembly protein PilP [Gynuella sp.]|uniref:pilus assembly protein PilP n=1 Tax=Gynuella sp. TaxID=2969146 RepID=UPI003D0C8FD5
MRILLLVLVCLGLFGCSTNDSNADLRQFVQEVERNAKGRIPPPPEFQPYEFFTYSAAGLRAPFEIPMEIEAQVQERPRSDVKPDLDRPREILEDFRVESLVMVGTIAMSDGELWALIRDPENDIHRVHVGNYMGKNNGKVLNIAATQIDMMEIVPDGQGGWLERPRTIMLNGFEP